MSVRAAISAMSEASPEISVRRRIATEDWNRVGEDLDAQGFAVIRSLLDANDCGSVSSLYVDDARFRSHIYMARHGFGRGEYKYYTYPLPETVAALRAALYPVSYTHLTLPTKRIV